MNFFPNSASFDRIIPPRGPRSVLCVVVVVTWACAIGDGYTPAATNPAKCAMSTMNSAPTSSATALIRAKSIVRGYADPPAMISFGRSARASASSCS